MTKVKKGDVVKVHYLAKANDKVIFDTDSVEPLKLKVGDNQVIPAFENALVGMDLGESKTINVSANDAFGPYLKELVSTVSRNQLPGNLELKEGQQLQIQQPDGSAILVTVTKLDDKTATFDANHPLAGKDITFLIELLEIA
jgi:FKBP-type peptidyl-prolyl cis-trans isomerase 2